MIHGNGAHEIQNISSLGLHLLTSQSTRHPRHHARMLVHVRRVPLLQFNLSSLRLSTAAECAWEGVMHPGDYSPVLKKSKPLWEGIYMRSAHLYPTGQNLQIDFKLEPLL